jgi:asparagine synthase (glutamine-hydrolysing)
MKGWIFRYPAGDREDPGPVWPKLWSASAAGIRAAFSGMLFEPELLAKRLALASDEAQNPAALILQAYVRLGDDWIHGLRGHYVAIVDDARHGRLIAARDAMGLHPLFFADAKDELLLSWSTEALVSQPHVSSDVNRVALADHLLHRWPDPTETYFSAVNRVPPGHVLVVDRTGRRLRRYWDPATEKTTPWLRDEEVAMFDQVLERAVTRCLMHGRAGVFLSGGFDSVSIASVAVDVARRLDHPVPAAASLAFPDPGCNEEGVQRGVARSLGMPHDIVPFGEAVGETGLLRPAIDMASTWPAPMMNLWQPAYFHLARRARDRGCSTILTGTGGDEWLTVTPYLTADYLGRGKLVEVARHVAMVQRSFRMSAPDGIRAALWTFGGKPLAGMLADRLAPSYWQARRRAKVVRATPDWVAPDSTLRQRVDERAERMLAPSQPFRGTFYEREMRTALDHPLMAIEAEEYFEFGRRLGVHIVHPYCDSDLVDLLYRTPPHLLSAGGRSKGLVRDAVARRFPTLGFERQRKVNATEFCRRILQTEGPSIWAGLGRSVALADLGVVDPSRLSATLTGLFEGRRPRETYRIWDVLHLEAWARSRA